MSARARFAFVLCSLSLLLHQFHVGYATVDRLRRFQRECFKDISPCVMFMNEEKSFGCAQCGEDVRSAPLREFSSRDELSTFIDAESEKRIIMIPELVFFTSKIVASLASPSTRRTVAAAIVYEGDFPSTDETDDEEALPFPPVRPVMSDDDTEPNRFYNFYNATELPKRCDESFRIARNPDAFCLKFKFFPFNVFRVNASIADRIRALARRFPDEVARSTSDQGNKTSSVAPRYKIESVGQMYACPSQPVPTPNADETIEDSGLETEVLVTSSECLQDRTCLPIGGHSLWSSLEHLPAPSESTPQQILAITAPMDSLAFFPDFSLGASGEVSSLAVMMAVAEAVGEYRRGPGRELEMLRQPVYFAWNAQSWGYAGSSRFLEDLANFRCEQAADVSEFTLGCVKPYMPSLKFLDLKTADFSVLNIGQMISPNETDTNVTFQFYTYGRDPSTNEGEVEVSLREAFTARREFNATNLSLGDDEETALGFYVPLDASQSFRRYKPDVDMITVTNYKVNITSKVYHTMYDNETLTEFPETLRQPMYAAAAAIASAVVKLAFGATVQLEINKTTIDEAVICMTGNWTRCELAKQYIGETFFEARTGNVIPGNYPGSFFPFTRLADRYPSAAAKLALIRNFFAYHNRYPVNAALRRCESLKDCETFINDLNKDVDPQSHSELRTGVCARGVCVASDTYTHNAFGTALNATNDAQSSFLYNVSKTKEFNGSDPQEAGWTESAWDPDLGLCGFVEDTTLYGGLVLLAGLLVTVTSVGLSLWLDRIMFKAPIQVSTETEPAAQRTTSV